MDSYQRLLLNNKAWAEDTVNRDPEFFHRLEKIQQPEFLWIGCSDSRVPANEITGTYPGEIFVHRNIANMVVHTDLNLLSVLQYAVEYLHVKHVIVCGHYGCGGVNAALENVSLGLIDNWLRHVQDVARQHRTDLEGLTERKQRARLCELNVLEQVVNASRTTIVKNAWQSGQELSVHGLIYDVKDGLLRALQDSVVKL